MRFYNYINEKKDIIDEEVIESIIQDCKPFLKDGKSKYQENFLGSGRQKKTKFEKRKMRTNRKPKDTPEAVHKEIDNGFYKKFGVKARSNTLFCTFRQSLAGTYGSPHIIFPIGQYKILSSDNIKDIYNILEDLFVNLTGFFDFDGNEIEYQENEEIFLNDLIKKLEQGNYKFNQYNRSEQMLICKEYYLYYPEHINFLTDFKNDILKGM